MAWVGRDLKGHQFPTLLHMQGHQPPDLILDQAAQGPIQPGLKHLQGWGIHNLSGHPVPAHALWEVLDYHMILPKLLSLTSLTKLNQKKIQEKIRDNSPMTNHLLYTWKQTNKR